MTGGAWTAVADALPEPKVTVTTESPGGMVQDLMFDHGFWFDPDSGVRVYYTPVRWRPLRA